MRGEKKLNEFTLRLNDRLHLELSKLANREDRSLSEYIRITLDKHVFGVRERLHDCEK